MDGGPRQSKMSLEFQPPFFASRYCQQGLIALAPLDSSNSPATSGVASGASRSAGLIAAPLALSVGRHAHSERGVQHVSVFKRA